METTKLKALYEKYKLTANDFYKHKHYTIITRQGIDKIQAKERIFIEYDVVNCTPEFCVVKASAGKGEAKIQTFGSAKYGGKVNKDGKWVEIGNTTTWYIAEMAEKRAMSRAVLKLTGFYELGVFGEDESEDFKRRNESNPAPKQTLFKGMDQMATSSLLSVISGSDSVDHLEELWKNNEGLHSDNLFKSEITKRKKILLDNGITE